MILRLHWTKSCLTPGLIVLALVVTGSVPADVFDYVAKPDDAFGWELRDVAEKPNGKVYDLHMVSQVWMGITWEHQIQVYEPARVDYADLMPMLITGGGAGDDDQAQGLMIANLLGARIAVLYHIPNQPLFENLGEDALISYTWVKYLETGEEVCRSRSTFRMSSLPSFLKSFSWKPAEQGAG